MDWALALSEDVEWTEEEQIVVGGPNYGGLMRNPSSDMINASPLSILATKMTFQETPLMGTCLINVREGRKPKNI